jgi:DNA-binding MarR family transcriptional regulator
MTQQQKAAVAKGTCSEALPVSDSHADRLLRLVHWTSTASRHLRKRLAELAKPFDLSDTELLVVWLCSGGGRIQVELAGAIGISPAQMSGMVERLRSRGLVAMHRLAMDRRRQVWRTTAGGQTLLADAAVQLNELAAGISLGLNAEEQNAAERLCERLAEAAGQKSEFGGQKSEIGRVVRVAAAAVVMLCALFSTGCSRSFWRRQADMDAYALVREKATHPHWRLPNYTISIDPRSRMYDPYAIDCSPIPPDDPTAHQFMHCVDNKRGWPFWHDNGDRPYVENPAWPEYINIDERGVLKLSVDDAVRLALIHSKDYQQQVETVYLSALDVAIERFRFDSQFFAGYTTFGTWTGPGNSGNSSSQLTASNFTQKSGAVGLGSLTNSTPLGILGSPATQGFWSINKAFTTGGQLVANFANQLVWQFSGNDSFTPTTVLNFSLIQPLLRGAGRDRIMEQLTLAERTLLYNVRVMEQYRQNFYVDTAVGGGTNNSTPTRGGSGGTFGQGLSGFTGVGATGFGGVTITGGGGGSAPAPGANNTSFIGLLQQQRLIRNQEDAVRRNRRNLVRQSTIAQEQPNPVTGTYLTDLLNVAQTRQSLLNNETNLITLRNQYQASLDTFKVTELYLPPQICIEPTDHRLDQFDVISQDIVRLPEEWEGVLIGLVEARRDIPERIQAHVEEVGTPPMCRLPRYPELDEDLIKLRAAFAEMQKFAAEVVDTHLPSIEADLQKFRDAEPRRKSRLERLAKRVEELLTNPCELLPLRVHPLEAAAGASATQLLQRFENSLARSGQSFNNLSANFRRYLQAFAARGELIDRLIVDKNQMPDQLFELLIHGVFNPQYECGKTRILSVDVIEDLNRELIELQLLQAVVRTELVDLEDVDLRAERAIEVARKYRRDWMNRRAQLVDSWRRLQFNADQLQAQLDVFLTGTMNNNINDGPFSLNANTGTLRAGVQFDTPLNRMSERNTYRQSLIEYQQTRRNYYNFEDSVAQSLRSQLRQITSFQINFEINRMAVLEAARQVMLNTFIDLENQRSQTSRATQARDNVQALGDLLQAQNNFMLIFISYEVQRLSLDFSLGTMQLDDEGLWIDPGKIGPDYGEYDPWVWRNTPGSIGHDGEKDDSTKKIDEALNQLPPPFLLPSGDREALPPAGAELVPQMPRSRGER